VGIRLGGKVIGHQAQQFLEQFLFVHVARDGALLYIFCKVKKPAPGRAGLGIGWVPLENIVITPERYRSGPAYAILFHKLLGFPLTKPILTGSMLIHL